MSRRRYRGKLGRNRRLGESANDLRTFLLADLGLPADVDGWVAFDALAARHVPFATVEPLKPVSFPGRPRKITPYDEAFLLSAIDAEMTANPRPLMTIIKTLMALHPRLQSYKPRTLAAAFTRRVERAKVTAKRRALFPNEPSPRQRPQTPRNP